MKKKWEKKMPLNDDGRDKNLDKGKTINSANLDSAQSILGKHCSVLDEVIRNAIKYERKKIHV